MKDKFSTEGKTMKTTERHGKKVLAGKDGYPVSYSNRTQAYNKIADLQAQGIQAEVYHWGRPFYVVVA